MIAMAGGIAATGLIPVVTTFAVFMLRAIETSSPFHRLLKYEC